MGKKKARAGVYLHGQTDKGKRGREESSTPTRFNEDHNEERFNIIKNWSFIPERRVHLLPGEYSEFNDELARRGWTNLAEPSEKYDPDIVREFYVNAWQPPTETRGYPKEAMVRGVKVYYTREAINDLLGNPMEPQEGTVCAYQRMRRRGFDNDNTVRIICLPGLFYDTNQAGKAMLIQRAYMRTLSQIWMTFLLANVTPTKHCSDVTMRRCHLLACILTGVEIDIAKILSEEIRQYVILEGGRNPAQSARSLGFPALITGLCSFFGVAVQPSVKIRPNIDCRFIEKNCLNEEEEEEEEGEDEDDQPAPPRPPTVRANSSIIEQMQQMCLKQDLLLQQNATIKRVQ